MLNLMLSCTKPPLPYSYFQCRACFKDLTERFQFIPSTYNLLELNYFEFEQFQLKKMLYFFVTISNLQIRQLGHLSFDHGISGCAGLALACAEMPEGPLIFRTIFQLEFTIANHGNAISNPSLLCFGKKHETPIIDPLAN